MNCHICGRPMRVIKREIIGATSDVVYTTEETWFCDECDYPHWIKALRSLWRRLRGNTS